MDQIPNAENERRLPVRLLNYWNKIRGARRFPSERLIEPEEIAALWNHCYLIQVNDLENRLKADFTYLGPEIIKTYKQYLAGEDTQDIIVPNSSKLVPNFRQVIERREPIMQADVFITSRGNTIRFRQCMLPLGEHDDRVEAIFGCMQLKLYP